MNPTENEPDGALTVLPAAPARVSLIAKLADRYSMEPRKFMDTLKGTAFKSEKPVSDEQMAALLVVADQYHLNPFTRELFAFPDRNGIVPVVSVDGWARIINEHPQFDGVQFHFSDDGGACTCVMFRKDRAHPTTVTEFLSECRRNTAPWQSHPLRMLRHKALIQCARIGFGFAGIFDEDEAQRIVGAVPVNEPASRGAERVRAILTRPDVLDAPDPTPERERERAAARQPSGWGLASALLELKDCTDADAAAVFIDRARAELPADQYAQLCAVYRQQWQTETE